MGSVLGAVVFAGAVSVLSPTSACTFVSNEETMTMTLTGDCSTSATIPIPDGWTLDGAGYTITAVDPPGGRFAGGVLKNGGSTAHVRNVDVTASALASACLGGASRLRGILFDGAGGSIVDTTVTNINRGASGCQEGNGIEVRNAPFDGTHPATVEVTIARNLVTNYQKNGITANGDVHAKILNNVVVGAGMVNHIAQNGIQLGFGATGQVRHNVVADNWYTPTSFVATGILLFEASGTIVQSNVVTDSQVGVAVEAWCLLAPSATNNMVLKNVIRGAQAGVSIHTFTYFSLCDPHADNNKVVQNTITEGVGVDSVGVSVGAFDIDVPVFYPNSTPSADNNKVVNNTIDGYATAIADAGTRTKIPHY